MTDQAPPQADSRGVPVGQIVKLSALALVVGLVAGAGASAFVAVQHDLTHWVWHELPSLIGFAEAPWWMVLLLPVIGGVLTYATFRLPGHGGHGPLDGFSLNIGPAEIVSAVLAALASLVFGAVLGPEAPLMAVGTALGALAVRKNQPAARQIMMIVGAMAAMGALFGSPLITSILLLEIALAAGATLARPTILLPSLVGLASGYLIQVGVAGWPGLGTMQMAVPGLAAYPSVRLIDLAVAVPLAILVTLLAIGARLGALRIAGLAKRSPLATIAGAGVVTGLAAVAVMLLTGGSYDLVLYSGQAAMPDYLAFTDLGMALTVLVAKFVAYTACLGGGFRGGTIFPSIALGTLIATIASPIVGTGPSTALVAAAIAAATAGSMRLTFTAVLLAVLLTADAGPATVIPAIIGAVAGMLIRLAAERTLPMLAPGYPAHA